jgi:hypothetical protein
MIHDFLNASKIKDCKNVIYFIASSQDFHLWSLFKDQHFEKLNLPTLFYGHPCNLTIFENLSYQQMENGNCFTYSKISPLIFLKLIKRFEVYLSPIFFELLRISKLMKTLQFLSFKNFYILTKMYMY